jgi:hypothetical protein
MRRCMMMMSEFEAGLCSVAESGGIICVMHAWICCNGLLGLGCMP